MANLTALKIKSIREPGMYGDGNGLYLKVSPGNARSWILRTVVHGRRRDLGLGSASLISLADAREKAREYRRIAREGGDPDVIRKRKTLTFEEAAKEVHKSLLPTWRNKRHTDSWLSSIEMYANPVFGTRPLDTIQTPDLLKVLTPIWTTKNDTASKLKQRLAAVFDWAKGAGHYPHENPANGLKKALPFVRASNNHYKAMHWRDLPGFWGELSEREGVSARALQFIILTASRSGEVRGARWGEFEGDLWTVPSERMKRHVQHRVPLSSEAIRVLSMVKGLDEHLVFPSPSLSRSGDVREQSDMVFKALFKRMGLNDLTTHGFRSTFRDWCSEYDETPRELAETALSHAVGSAVERAYARSDLLERRISLMERWSNYVTGKLPIRKPENDVQA